MTLQKCTACQERLKIAGPYWYKLLPCWKVYTIFHLVVIFDTRWGVKGWTLKKVLRNESYKLGLLEGKDWKKNHLKHVYAFQQMFIWSLGRAKLTACIVRLQYQLACSIVTIVKWSENETRTWRYDLIYIASLFSPSSLLQ